MYCYVVKKEGISKKTGKPYEMYVLVVETEKFGDVEIVLDNRTSRAGIILSLLADNKRKEG